VRSPVSRARTANLARHPDASDEKGNSMTSTGTKLVRGLALAGALLVALTACSSKGGANQAANGPATKRYTIAMITHETPGDTFWDRVRAGAQAAAAQENIELKYSNNPAAPQQATLVQNAITSKVDGIATTMASPEAIGPQVQAARKAGIPVVAFNSGIQQYKQYGAQMYFGSDETVAGQAVGSRITQEGGGSTLCIIQEAGQVALEDRCAGVTKNDPSTQILNVDDTNMPAVESTIQAKLQQDPSIKYVVTLGAPIAISALQAKAGAKSNAKIITFDLNADIARDIQNGSVEFSVDQQPYVEGYMAVTGLWLYLTNGDDIGGGQPVLTGPSYVDKSNIGQIAPYAQKNTR
jgi:simple sugar transport system substrate-binding protein